MTDFGGRRDWKRDLEDLGGAWERVASRGTF